MAADHASQCCSEATAQTLWRLVKSRAAFPFLPVNEDTLYWHEYLQALALSRSGDLWLSQPDYHPPRRSETSFTRGGGRKRGSREATRLVFQAVASISPQKDAQSTKSPMQESRTGLTKLKPSLHSLLNNGVLQTLSSIQSVKHKRDQGVAANNKPTSARPQAVRLVNTQPDEGSVIGVPETVQLFALLGGEYDRLKVMGFGTVSPPAEHETATVDKARLMLLRNSGDRLVIISGVNAATEKVTLAAYTSAKQSAYVSERSPPSFVAQLAPTQRVAYKDTPHEHDGRLRPRIVWSSDETSSLKLGEVLTFDVDFGMCQLKFGDTPEELDVTSVEIWRV